MQTPAPLITFATENLFKKFDRKIIFKDISFSLSNGESLAVTGRNGSGKSTLIKILTTLISQTSGSITLNIDNKPVERRNYYNFIGLVSPYLNLYDEFTGYENMQMISNIRGTFNKNDLEENINSTLKKVGLYERRNDILRIYSSGMRQRLKIAFAILHDPQILFLDEPTDNLDAEGIKIVDDIVNDYKENKIIIVATNSEYEKGYCQKEVRIAE